jgi:hypothetical protein
MDELDSVPWQAISMVVDCMWFFSRCHWQHAPVISNNNNPKQLLERFCDQKLLAAAAWT